MFQCPEGIFHAVKKWGSGMTCLDFENQASPPATVT